MAGGLALFTTVLGRCGIGWTAHGVAVVRLPDAGDDQLLAGLRRLLPAATPTQPPPAVQHAIDGIVALLRGEGTDLREVTVDLTGVPAFHQAVYEATREIPAGSTRSYGELARAIGVPGAARAVGHALGRNPVPIVVPCHRVLAAGGRSGGFSAPGGVRTKYALLAAEGAAVPAVQQALPFD